MRTKEVPHNEHKGRKIVKDDPPHNSTHTGSPTPQGSSRAQRKIHPTIKSQRKIHHTVQSRQPVCFYDESIRREVQTKPKYECWCDERLKTKTEESTRLVYTGWLGELEYLKIETRLIDEMFASVMGECVI